MTVKSVHSPAIDGILVAIPELCGIWEFVCKFQVYNRSDMERIELCVIGVGK